MSEYAYRPGDRYTVPKPFILVIAADRVFSADVGDVPVLASEPVGDRKTEVLTVADVDSFS